MQPQSQSFMGIYVQVWVLWDAVQQVEGGRRGKVTSGTNDQAGGMQSGVGL